MIIKTLMETFLPKKICEKHLVSASEDSIKSICVLPVIPYVFLSFHSSRKTLISPHFSRLMNWKDTDKKLSRHLIKTLGLNFSIKNVKDMSFDSLVLRTINGRLIYSFLFTKSRTIRISIVHL